MECRSNLFSEEVLRRSGKDNSAGLLDIISTGLGFADLAALTEFRAVRAADPDAAPGLPDHPIVRHGDVWLLGDHRIACGDSTDSATVRSLLGGDRPHLMVTDPPYGVKYDPSWREAIPSTWTAPRSLGVVHNDARIDWSAAWRLFPGEIAYVWHAGVFASQVQDSLETSGFAIRCQIIWVKQHFVFGRGDYHWQHEPCWYAVRKGAKGTWAGDRKQTTTWYIQNASAMGGDRSTNPASGHGTQKPIECMRRPIENNSRPGDYVYEPFSGSGTTIIAAEMTQRRCLAIELNPLYVYVAISRWQNFVGRTATLRDTGETFAEVVRRRMDEPDKNQVQVIMPSTTAVEEETAGVDGIIADFDPVLMELICEWYCPLGGSVLDVEPNEVRRRVAEHLRREYLTDGAAQVDLLVFTQTDVAPIAAAAARLRDDRFAIAVVKDMRGEDGYLSGFPQEVVTAFRTAGLRLFDEAVYTDGQCDAEPENFARYRRTQRSHRNVLVFIKGSWEKAVEACQMEE